MAAITMFVPRVRCVDETTGKWREKMGNDEMYLGAVYVGVSANRAFDVRVVRSRSVGDNFDDQETVNWNRPLFTFDLGNEATQPFPKAALASLVLAEHDWGNGRNDVLEKIAEQFREKLTAAVIDGVAKAALVEAGIEPGGGGAGSGATGGTGPVIRDHRGDDAPTWTPRGGGRGAGEGDGPAVRDHRREAGGGPRDGDADVLTRRRLDDVTADGTSGGALTGTVVTGTVLTGTVAPAAPPAPADGIVVAALKDWAKDQLKKISDALIAKAKEWAGDDVFPPVLKAVDLPNAGHSWYGSNATPEEVAEFTAHEGKYQVTVYWQLEA